MTAQEAIDWLQNNFWTTTGESVPVEQQSYIGYSWREVISGPYHLSHEHLQTNTKGGASAVWNNVPIEVWRALWDEGLSASVHIIYQGRLKRRRIESTMAKEAYGDWQFHQAGGQMVWIETEGTSHRYSVTARTQPDTALKDETKTPANFTSLEYLYVDGQRNWNINKEIALIDPSTGTTYNKPVHAGWRFARLLNSAIFTSESSSKEAGWQYSPLIFENPTITFQNNKIIVDPLEKVSWCDLDNDYTRTSWNGIKDLESFAAYNIVKNKWNNKRFNYCYALVLYSENSGNNLKPAHIIYGNPRVIEWKDLPASKQTTVFPTLGICLDVLRTSIISGNTVKIECDMSYNVFYFNSLDTISGQIGIVATDPVTGNPNLVIIDLNTQNTVLNKNDRTIDITINQARVDTNITPAGYIVFHKQLAY